jgi:hypothetical protein
MSTSGDRVWRRGRGEERNHEGPEKSRRGISGTSGVTEEEEGKGNTPRNQRKPRMKGGEEDRDRRKTNLSLLDQRVENNGE